MFRHDSPLHFLVGLLAQKRSSVCLPKQGEIYTKDVVCLPSTKETKNIPIPGGNKRAQLAEMGLIGRFQSTQYGEQKRLQKR